jgi:hypothetical protein
MEVKTETARVVTLIKAGGTSVQGDGGTSRRDTKLNNEL